MKKWKESFHLYAMITIIFWSLAYVLSRFAVRYFSPYSLGFLRCASASAALLIVVLVIKMKPPARGDLKWFAASGAAGFFLYMIFFNTGCKTVTASTSSILIATVPVMTALFAHFLQGEELRRIQWFAMAVEFAGVLILSVMGGSVVLNLGILWTLLAAVSLASYNLLQRRLTKTYSALQASSYSIFGGTLLLAIFLPVSAREALHAPLPMILAVLALGIFSSAAAYASWSQAFAKAEKTSSVSNYMFVTPFLTTLLGFLFLGEEPGLADVTGGLIILFGMFVFYFGETVWNSLDQRKARL